MNLKKVIDGTVTAGGTIESVLDFSDVRRPLSLTVRATYNASATKGVRVYLLFSPDGVMYDTLEDAEAQGSYFDVTFAAGATRQSTVPIIHSGVQVKVLVKNLDSSYPASVVAWLAEVPEAGVSRPKWQNLDVLLSTRASESTFRDAISASGSVAAANNTTGLSVSINNDFRDLIHFKATLGGAGDIYVETSFDGLNWFTMWSKSLTAAGTLCDWELCGASYFRIRVPTTGIDVAIDIRGVKL
jgi:hypothetical protein